jgi:hypothetical protein
MWVLVRDTAIKKEKNHKHKPRWPGPLIVIETRPQTEADILVEPGGTVLLTQFTTSWSIPYCQHEGLMFHLDKLLKPVKVDKVVEVEENEEPREAEPEEKTEKSEEELTCAKIGEYWERLTGVDGVVWPKQRSVGLALVWSSFAGTNMSRLLATLLFLRGHETAILGREEREGSDSVIIEENFAINEVEGS